MIFGFGSYWIFGHGVYILIWVNQFVFIVVVVVVVVVVFLICLAGKTSDENEE